MELLHEFAFSGELDGPPLMVGPGPYGTRVVASVKGGSVEGERLRGKLVGSGGDWMLVGPDGLWRIDVRTQFQLDDGAAVYVRLDGIWHVDSTTRNALKHGDATEFEDHYFRTLVRLESGDPRYAWVNESVFVGEGRLRPGSVIEYHVHRVA